MKSRRTSLMKLLNQNAIFGCNGSDLSGKQTVFGADRLPHLNPRASLHQFRCEAGGLRVREVERGWEAGVIYERASAAMIDSQQHFGIGIPNADLHTEVVRILYV